MHCNVEPLSGLGPANIKQIGKRNNLIEGVKTLAFAYAIRSICLCC